MVIHHWKLSMLYIGVGMCLFVSETFGLCHNALTRGVQSTVRFTFSPSGVIVNATRKETKFSVIVCKYV